METDETTKAAGGISWGMRDDAEEEIDLDRNPLNIMSESEKEATYVKDPKKTLRGYFEREGVELEYKVEEKEKGFNNQFICKVELPIDDADGEPIIAEAAVSGKKKEAVVACAMEACRILDAHGVLRQAMHESKQKKKKNWAEDDYYDSDDDSYLDRTGMVEKKRTQRMMKAGVIKQKVDNYDSLLVKLSKVNTELDETENELNILKQEQSSAPEGDTLDDFIDQLKSGKAVDKTKRAKMKLRIIELGKEQSRLQRLIKLVQPASMPIKSDKSQSTFASLSQRLPMKGFMKGRKIPHTKPKQQVKLVVTPETAKPEEEEVEEDEDEDEQITDLTEKTSPESAASKLEVMVEDDISVRKSVESVPEQIPQKVEKKDDPKSKEPRVSPSQPKRPKRVLGPQMGPLIKFKEFMDRDEEEESTSQGPKVKKKKDEKFADWIPPDDQKGDGRTFLNDKYGY